jgi:raffinose/stachyose/melibiose transport system permease protein
MPRTCAPYPIRNVARIGCRMKHRIYPLYLALGAVALYLVFLLVPGVMGLYYSLTDWNSYTTEINFVGLENFGTILTSNINYAQSIKNTVVFTIVTIVAKTAIALAVAILLTTGIRKSANFHRVTIYLPAVLPMLVVGIVFKSILHPTTGLLNESLRAIGLDFLAQRWLTNPDLALFSVIGVDTWKGVGYLMVILIAGIQAIPREYYEAAQIDGAGAFAQFRLITLPLLMPALAVTTVLNLLYGLKVFDVVWVLTNGGPGYATETVYTTVFKEFSKGRYGVSTALSTMLFLIMAFLGYFVIRLMSNDDTS